MVTNVDAQPTLAVVVFHSSRVSQQKLACFVERQGQLPPMIEVDAAAVLSAFANKIF